MSTNNKKEETNFWSTDTYVLLDTARLTSVWPDSTQLTNANLNAICRLGIYIGLCGRLFGLSASILVVPVFAAIVSYLMFIWREQKTHRNTYLPHTQHDALVESFPVSTVRTPSALHQSHPTSTPRRVTTIGSTVEPETQRTTRRAYSCRAPTISNPFGNILLSEMQKGTRQQSCSRMHTPNPIQQQNSAFQAMQQPSANQIVFNDGSLRQFFTMPWTSVPNDANGDFGNWLYDTPPITKGQSLWFSPV